MTAPPLTRALTPGAYLKHRRCAALLSIADVAAVLATEPRLAQHVRADWLRLIEADAMPASFNTIVALRTAFPFDLDVLERLVEIEHGSDLPAPLLCRICAARAGDVIAAAADTESDAWWWAGVCPACHADQAFTGWIERAEGTSAAGTVLDFSLPHHPEQHPDTPA